MERAFDLVGTNSCQKPSVIAAGVGGCGWHRFCKVDDACCCLGLRDGGDKQNTVHSAQCMVHGAWMVKRRGIVGILFNQWLLTCHAIVCCMISYLVSFPESVSVDDGT